MGTDMTDRSGHRKGDAIKLAESATPPHAPDVAGNSCPSGEAAAPMEEITGRIKWFDLARGFGFITRPDGPDVMLHAAALRREGRSAIREGAHVTCIAAQGPRGLHVVRIVAIDDAGALNPAEAPPAHTHVTVTPESGLEAATVKWFNRLRGFGFVSCGPGQPDIFVHMEVARRCGALALRPGQAVAVRYGSGPQGLMATEVYPLDDAGPGVRH